MNRVILEVRTDGEETVFLSVYTETVPVFPPDKILFTVFAAGKLALFHCIRWVPAQDSYETILKGRCSDREDLQAYLGALDREGWVLVDPEDLR